MAWRAYLESVIDPPVPTGAFEATIRFEDVPTSRIIRQTFKFMLGQTGAQMKAVATNYRDDLGRLDTVKAAFNATIGQEIT